jgi:hypothetical protein
MLGVLRFSDGWLPMVTVPPQAKEALSFPLLMAEESWSRSLAAGFAHISGFGDEPIFGWCGSHARQ